MNKTAKDKDLLKYKFTTNLFLIFALGFHVIGIIAEDGTFDNSFIAYLFTWLALCFVALVVLRAIELVYSLIFFWK